MTLAEKIQSLRKEKGLSQDQLALELGVSRQSVSKWELGVSMPDINKVLQLADYFQVSTDTLLREEIEIPAKEPDPTPVRKTAADQPYEEDIHKEATHANDSSDFTTDPHQTTHKRPFERAFQISLKLTIFFLLLPFIILPLVSLFPVTGMRFSSTELLLIILVVYLTIVPITGGLTLVFWILHHLKK